MGLSVTSFKYISIAVLLVGSFFTFLLPYLILKCGSSTARRRGSSKFQRLFQILNCLTGGILLGVVMLDLLPDVDDDVQEALEALEMTGNWLNFPFSYFLSIIGMLFILTIEQIVLTFATRSNLVINIHDHDDEDEDESQPLVNHQHQEQQRQNSSPQGKTSLILGLVLLGALSLHSIFEGLSLGLEEDFDSFTIIFIAIIMHKFLVAFSLGLKLVEGEPGESEEGGAAKGNYFLSGSPLKICSCSLIFSIMSPIGITIGLLVVSESNLSTDVVTARAVLQAMACGTFLYVIFFEILPQQFKHRGPNHCPHLLRLLAMIGGFALSTTVVILDEVLG